jgi:chromosome segregation ATPase
VKKYLIALALIVPVIAMAADLNTAATDDFVNAVKDVEAKVDEAGKLLDDAVNTFFGMLDSIVELPEISTPKEEVMAALESATKKKEIQAAEELYEKYLAELAERDKALEDMWNNSEIKQEIVTYFSNRKEMAMSIKENVENAVKLDVEAIKSLTDLPDKGQAAVEDLTNQISADPTVALQAKKVIKAVKEAIDSIKATKEKASQQKETAEKLLNWMKDLVKSE